MHSNKEPTPRSSSLTSLATLAGHAKNVELETLMALRVPLRRCWNADDGTQLPYTVRRGGGRGEGEAGSSPKINKYHMHLHILLLCVCENGQ